MNDIDSLKKPVFLDGDDGSPRELPLMVTRHTLRSLGLAKALLEQLNVRATTEGQLKTSIRTTDAPVEVNSETLTPAKTWISTASGEG